jgi:hypothetical protein
VQRAGQIADIEQPRLWDLTPISAIEAGRLAVELLPIFGDVLPDQAAASWV